MRTDTFILPFFNEKEEHFVDSIVVFIDVLRASTTICAALSNGAREVIPADTMDKALSLHSNLSRETRYLAGERNSLKPNGFDSGNSPSEFTNYKISGKSIVLTTTNGTRLFNLIKNSRYRIIGSFVNLSAVIGYINNNHHLYNVDICCAGNNGRFSFEDALCAGAIINGINNPDSELTDSSLACRSLFWQHKHDLKEFIKSCEHSRRLIEIGHPADIDDSLMIDKYPVIPVLSGNSFRLLIN